GWKGGDRSGLAQGQELTGRKRRTKTSLQEMKKERKTSLTLTGPLMEGVDIACLRTAWLVSAREGISLYARNGQ
ncbi:MAG TPA: hypothetical protein VMO80_16980, partial [Terriglobales bacterium]|nr:hypothetical protein [Terriglobales bacterium]